MRLIDADDVIDFYKAFGEKNPELRKGVHFSISDIIQNLDNIPTVKKEKIMAMTNAEWIISTGHHFKQLRLIQHNELANRTYTVALCDEPIAELKEKGEPLDVFRKWLDAEHVEPILDDAEKRYLKGVIRPFRNQIISIYKEQFGFNHESIIIEYYDFDRSQSTLCLPQFEKGSMYAGMKTGWRYTLEELGL